VSHLGLYIGLHGSAKDLGLEQANKWVYQDYDHDASLRKFMAIPQANANTVGNIDFPLNYISFPSSKDPAWDSHYPGKSTIDVISLAPMTGSNKWADKPWKNRGADYDDFKAVVRKAAGRRVQTRAPGARQGGLF
jgi:all-trans-retinol 13,14-reductase